jgi:LPS-assembly protein
MAFYLPDFCLRSKALRLGKFIQFTPVQCGRHFALMAWLLLMLFALPAHSQEKPEGQVRSEIRSKNGTVVLVSDFQEALSKSRYRATGHVMITYQDTIMTGETAEYDRETHEGFVIGPARFSQGQQYLTCSMAKFNTEDHTATFYDATGYLDRQFMISGRTISKTGKDTYRVEGMSITACKQKRPKWTFDASSANVTLNETFNLHKMVFRIKGVPVFYFPYIILPMEKRSRSSGFVPFHTGTSTSKGRVFSEGYYQTLGPSADLMVYEDYFTLRGLALGGLFRIRPNPATHFSLQAYGIHDKLGQGGVQLMVDGETSLKDNWRAVARVNITSNFIFRQAFSDSFRAATVPQELATVFLTRNNNSISTNIEFERREVSFPIHTLVLRKLPSIELNSVGTPLGKSPFILSFRTSLDGLSRLDSSTKTPGLIQRMDAYPRLSLRLPAWKGFSLMPSAGIRETYYSAQQPLDPSPGIINQALHRQYADFTVNLKMPILERDFPSSPIGEFKHTVEPYFTYRRIEGIKDLAKTIRFDEEDAIANTNELEYGIMNRFYRSPKNSSGVPAKYEFMSFGLVQRYYFDPSFGGAFQLGKSNAFYPLDAVSGFYPAGIMHDFSPISAIFQISPKGQTYSELRADFDPVVGHWRNVSISTSWQVKKFIMAGTYFGIRALEAGMPAGNHLEGQAQYGSGKSGFLSIFSAVYDIQTSQLLTSNTHIGYMWDCCGVDLDFNQFNFGFRTESRVSFSFTLKGIGSFGNVKHPGSLFF